MRCVTWGFFKLLSARLSPTWTLFAWLLVAANGSWASTKRCAALRLHRALTWVVYLNELFSWKTHGYVVTFVEVDHYASSTVTGAGRRWKMISSANVVIPSCSVPVMCHGTQVLCYVHYNMVTTTQVLCSLLLLTELWNKIILKKFGPSRPAYWSYSQCSFYSHGIRSSSIN